MPESRSPEVKSQASQFETKDMRRNVLMILVLALVAGTALGASSMEYPGPLGIKWGMHTAATRSILNGKLQFLDERPSERNGYHVVEQRYQGRFGDFPTKSPIVLKFFQGDFYFLEVELAIFTRVSKLFEAAVDKMREVYGEPELLTRPTMLYSGRAGMVGATMTAQERTLLSLYRQDREGEDGRYALLDAQIMTGLYKPYAKWTFANDVMVRIWVEFAEGGDGRPAPRLLWRFVKQDLEKGANAPNLFKARDY